MASRTQQRVNAKRNLELDPSELETKFEIPGTPRTIQRHASAELISNAMSKDLKLLLAATETNHKLTKIVEQATDEWMMLIKRYLEKAHANASPLEKAWTIIGVLESEGRDYITNKTEAQRNTDDKMFPVLARSLETGSSNIHIQEQFRTRTRSATTTTCNTTMLLRASSQGLPNEEVAVRCYGIIQKLIEGIRNFELTRKLALMYAQEQYVEETPTVDAPLFTRQQYLRMRSSTCSKRYTFAQQQPTRLLTSLPKYLPLSSHHNSLRLSESNTHRSHRRTPW